MEKQRNKRIEHLFWCGLFLVTLGMVWTVQRAIPFMMDDEWYSTLLYSEEPLRSMGDIISAQIWHYFNWGGRSMTHTLLQMILCMGETFADICNTLAVFLLSFLISALAGKKKSLAFITITAGLLHGVNASWKMSMYWQAGACNYLYITIFILLFLMCYLKTLEDTPDVCQKSPAGIYLYILPLGLIVGWSNENMGPAVWLMTLGVMLWRKRKRLPVKPWMVLGNLACLAGSMLMILAPGNFVRAGEVASSQYGGLWQLFLRCYAECRGLLEYLFIVCLLTAFILFLNICILGEKPDRKEMTLLAGALLSWGAMVLSPHYPDRASFGTMVLLLCVLLSQTVKLMKLRPEKKVRCAVAAMGILLWLRGMYFLGEYLAIYWGWIV